MRSCFFIGHRTILEDLGDRLRGSIERHIMEYGVRLFVVGHYGDFDRLVTRTLVEAKKRHPEIQVLVLLPYHPGRGNYQPPEGVDGTFYPPGQETRPKIAAIPAANEYMIRHSDYLICYDRGEVGKTRDFVRLARGLERQGRLHVENLAGSGAGESEVED